MRSLLPALLMLFCCISQPLAASSAHRHELGSAILSATDGSLYAATVSQGHVWLQRSQDDGASWSTPLAVNQQPENIAADGENRPKLAQGPQGQLYVSWARRFEQRFTGDLRFARSEDGRQFEPPYTVHQDRSPTGHSFNSLQVQADGRLLMVWIDGRERLNSPDYAGSALFAAISTDHGRSFSAEHKLVDHSCQCCRLALAPLADGRSLLLWRHVFPGSIRDHALLTLDANGKPLQPLQRVTFDNWQIDACPHHGPSLALDSQERIHAVWFNHQQDRPGVFHGRLQADGVQDQRRLGGPRAAHADLLSKERQLAIVWKEFDGQHTRLRAELSEDDGASFRSLELAHSAGASDQPRLLLHRDRLWAFWHTADQGLRLYPL